MFNLAALAYVPKARPHVSLKNIADSQGDDSGGIIAEEDVLGLERETQRLGTPKLHSAAGIDAKAVDMGIDIITGGRIHTMTIPRREVGTNKGIESHFVVLEAEWHMSVDIHRESVKVLVAENHANFGRKTEMLAECVLENQACHCRLIL